jgi:cytochrome c5
MNSNWPKRICAIAVVSMAGTGALDVVAAERTGPPSPTESSDAMALLRDRSGKEIVEVRCKDCHEQGKDGAPRIGDQAAWIPRLKNGLDVTVRSAIHGHGKMPARGGMAEFTDTEIRRAIVYMFHADPAAK